MITKEAQSSNDFADKSTATKIRIKTRYAARTNDLKNTLEEELKPIYSNTAGDSTREIIDEFNSFSSLRPDLKNQIKHIVFSPELGDRELTPEEWKRAIDIYRSNRKMGEAPFAAWLHDDGHEGRNKFHVHLIYMRIKPDGKTVPDSWDSSVNRKTSREIERALNLEVNAGADEKHKYNGRDKHAQRERASERIGAEQNVNPLLVQQAINKSRNTNELRSNLKEAGIDCRFRRRNGEIYAWSLKPADGKYWTSGSKITASNQFGWMKVNSLLNQNFADRPVNTKLKRHSKRVPRIGATKPPVNHKRLDQMADAAWEEATQFLQSLLAQTAQLTTQRKPVAVRAEPTRPRTLPVTRKPSAAPSAQSKTQRPGEK